MNSSNAFEKLPKALKIVNDGAIQYIAQANPGTAQDSPNWQVRKIDKTTGVVITWADGNAKFDNIATNLTALTYS